MHVESHHHAHSAPSGPLRGLLIIGGTSDLSRRHLLPALTRLLANNELPEGFGVTLTGLEAMSTDACRELIAGELEQHASDLPSDARHALAERITYLEADVRDSGALAPLAPAEPSLIYVATPPEAVPAVLDALEYAAFHRSARIVLDKPFGLSRTSARALNTRVLELFDESQVFRIDHFLYHHVVQELIRRRVEADLLAPGPDPLAEVEIRWDETREAPPSSGGVMRDMIQSHLLQLAAVVTMEQPSSLTHSDLARHRLEALRRLTPAGTREDSKTTATLSLRSDMPGWEGVHLVLTASKGAETSRRHIEFRTAAPSPRAVRLEVLSGRVVAEPAAAAGSLEFSPDPETASTRLLRAALAGDDTFTLSAEEPEEAWRIVEGTDE